MAETPVVNASPLIYLSKAGLIHLLQLLSPQIFVPDAVATAILHRGKSDITIAEARPVLNRLQQAGMYLSSTVINQALQMVGE